MNKSLLIIFLLVDLWNRMRLIIVILSVTEVYFHGNLSEILRNLNGI